MKRQTLTDAQWDLVESLLPPQKPATGRPAKDHRTVVEGILWQLATGTPWRDLPERFGPWQTLYSRYRRWRQSGVWDRVQHALGANGEVDWALLFADGAAVRTMPPAPPPAPEPITRPSTTTPSTSTRSTSNSNGVATRWSAW
jgi:transposase